MKVLLDMNLSLHWVQFLSDDGIECIHWSNVGDPRAADAEIMQWARDHGFVLFTNDMDFGPQHGRWAPAFCRLGSRTPCLTQSGGISSEFSVCANRLLRLVHS